MGLCEDCTFWERTYDAPFFGYEWGTCELTKATGEVQKYNQSKAAAFTRDTEVSTYLDTRSDFGCVQFQAKAGDGMP